MSSELLRTDIEQPVRPRRVRHRSRECGAPAVRTLAELEFEASPCSGRLPHRQSKTAQPAPATRVDQLLLLRFAIRRGKYPWTQVLEQSGLAPARLRTSRGTLIRARDGHLCLSLRERAVCDFLHQHDIDHDREPLYPTDDVLNPNGRRRADGFSPTAPWSSCGACQTTPSYAAKMVEKRELAQRHGDQAVR